MLHTDLTVEVAVPKLLATLRKNREKHLKAYEQAKKGYYKLLARELQVKMDVVRGISVRPANKKYATLSHVLNQKPTNYLAYYDQAIEMLEFTTDEHIRLDAQQYQQYVKDEWNWSPNFTTSNVAYARAAR